MPIPLRADFDAGMVRAAAKRSKDGPQARRLLALAAIYEGASRTEAAKIGGVTLQIVRDWVMKFNAHGPEGLIDCKPPGQPSRLNGAHRAALAAILESGPIPAVHGVVRWRIVDLCQWIFEEFRVVVAKQTLSRELRAMGYRSSRLVPVITSRLRARSRILKKLSRAPGRDRAREGRRACRHRGLVRRRGPHRPKEQDHPALGQARHASKRADGPTNRLGLYLRRDLPQARKGCSPHHAQMQHGGHEPAPGRNRRSDRAGRTRGASRRSGRLASVGPARHAAQHHLDPVAGEMSGAQSAGKRLAVPARQLALKPNSSNPTTMSSTIAARLGTTSSINPGGSCPSAFAIGPMGPDQRVLVLANIDVGSWLYRRIKPGGRLGSPARC